MMELWNMCLEAWLAYWGNGWHILLFALGLLYLILSRKERDNRQIFVGYAMVAVLIFFLPPTAHVIADYCIGRSVYWRVLWLLPVPLVIAYVCTRIATAWKNAGIQMVLAAVFLGVIVLAGSQVYVADNFEWADNREKVYPEVKTIADLIREDAGGKRKKVAVPESLASYIRIYAPDILMPYGRAARGATRDNSRQLYNLLNQEWANPAQVAQLARNAHCSYLVVQAEDGSADQEFEATGYALIGTVENYRLYKRV